MVLVKFYNGTVVTDIDDIDVVCVSCLHTCSYIELSVTSF